MTEIILKRKTSQEKLKNVFEEFVDETPSINPTKKNGTDNTNDPISMV